MRCSFVSPEAPLMVQATIIFLFRICLGGLINLLRIHNSIYQNNGTLLGNQNDEDKLVWRLLQIKLVLRIIEYDLNLFGACWEKLNWLKSDQLYISQHLCPPPCKCTVSGCCLVIRQRNREAFQVMTVLVLKRFECLQHKKGCNGSNTYTNTKSWQFLF